MFSNKCATRLSSLSSLSSSIHAHTPSQCDLCCHRSLGNLHAPGTSWEQEWGTGSTEIWQFSPEKCLQLNYRDTHWPQEATKTHIQQHCALKRHQLCYSLCLVILLLGEKWNYPTISPTAHKPALPWCMCRASHGIWGYLWLWALWKSEQKRELARPGHFLISCLGYLSNILFYVPAFVWVFLQELSNWCLTVIIRNTVSVYKK